MEDRQASDSFPNEGFTSSQSQLHWSNSSLEIFSSALAQQTCNDYLKPKNTPNSDPSYSTASGSAQQKPYSQNIVIEKKKCIAVTIILVCVFTTIVVGGFTFMGKHLSENAGTDSNIDAIFKPSTTTSDFGEDTSWPTTTETLSAMSVSSEPDTTPFTATIPVECRTAQNLSEYWRMEHHGGDIRPRLDPESEIGYACDLHESLEWFRFVGAAGNRFLNTCPPFRSCGGQFSFWTDSEMPQKIGVVSRIFVYSRYSEETNWSCRGAIEDAYVIRCSWDTDYDFVYRVDGPNENECFAAFCGMS
ncbi:uncharacterized protein [Watersipora subatra]|uniref:uncharacterized protein n=1 Tax=Watersipora subatra TaxID=2589382 RepID=UPI00355B0311